MRKKTTSFLMFSFSGIRNFFFLILIVWFANCTSKDHQSDCTLKKLDYNCCPTTDTSYTDLPAVSISSINVFVETSGSMKGYMPADAPATGFQKIIPEILSNLNTQQPGKVKFYSIFNSARPFENLDVATAINKIQYGKFEWSGSTYLPSMLDSISKKHFNKNEVNIFISDCIYSPEKRDEKDQEIAQTYFRDVMKPYSNDFSTSIFCLLSEYRVKNTIASPYYLTIQGEPQNIFSVERLLLKSFVNYGQSYDEVNFGLKFNRPFYSVLPYSETSGNFIAFPCDSFQNGYLTLQDVTLKPENDSIQFWIGLDLKSFPEYTRDSRYLDSNLSVSVGNGNTKMITVTDKMPSSIVTDDKAIANKCSHFIKVKIYSLTEQVSVLNISLKYTRPEWIQLRNEPTYENNRSKTYKLEKLISGFEQAYDQDNNAYFFRDFSIAVIKK